MPELTPYAALQRLDRFTLPIFTSVEIADKAMGMATRFVHAHAFLSDQFAIGPDVGLVILSPADWPRYAHAAFPQYGLTHYDHGRQMVITGISVGDFRQPALAAIQRLAPAHLPALSQVYGQPAGGIDLTSHVDLYVVHDLGHACHLHRDYWFPRRWLMEYFADLCTYTYIATHEPEQLPALQTFPQAMQAIPTAHWSLRTLQDFDAYYGKAEMSVENYLWFHGHLFAVAQQEYQRAGLQALQQLWQTFVVSNLQTVTDAQLLPILTTMQPHLVQLLKEK